MSAPDLNQDVLLGRLTKEPARRELPDGRGVCEMRLAVNEVRERDALFIEVDTLGKQADACARYPSEGREVAVAGRLTLDEWETKDGERRCRYPVIGRVSFGNDRNENGAGPDGRDD